jgi:hypothetical protein
LNANDKKFSQLIAVITCVLLLLADCIHAHFAP